MAGTTNLEGASRTSGARRAGGFVLFGCFVCQMGLGLAYVFPVVLKDIVSEFGWSRTAFAGSSAPLLLAMGLASPVIGALTDRFGARWVLSAATLLLGGCLWLLSAMQSLLHFYLVVALIGLALTGLGDIPVGAVAARWFARNRGLALAIVYIGSNIGGALAANAVAMIKQAASWQASFQILGSVAVGVLLPFAIFVVRNPPSGAAAEETAPPDEAEEESLTPQQALRTRTFWVLAVLLFVFYFYYLGVNNHLVAFLSDRGYSDAEAARRFSAAILLGVAGKLVIGLLADRIPLRRALLLNFALLTLGSFLLLALGLPGFLPAFLILHGFTVAAENVLLPLIVAHCFGVRYMASIYGRLMIALPAGGILGPIFAGYTFDRLGSYEIAFTTFAVLNLLALGLLALVRRETSQTPLRASSARKA